MKLPITLAALCCGIILASCGGGSGGGGNPVVGVPPTTNPPTRPTNVSATVGSGTITLSWQGVTSANYYNVYYRNTAGVTPQNGIKIGNVSPPETVSGLTNGQPYYFIVTGVNSGGEGSASAEFEATPELQRVKIVGGIYATPGNSEATIEWDSQVDASSYNLYWWTDLANQKTQVPDVTSPYVMGGLQNGTTYNFEVAAVNSLGEGQHSPGFHATPIDPATGWTPQIRITDRFFQQSGGQSEGTNIGIRDISSNDTGIVAVAASVCGGRCTLRSVVIYHNAEGDWVGPVNMETGVQTLRPTVVVTPAGHILVAYERGGRGNYARLYRNGVWEDPVRIDSRGFQYFRAWVDLASDNVGNIFAVWMEAIDLVPNDRNSQVQQVWTSRYDAASDIWGSPTMLVESVRSVLEVTVDVAENDHAVAAWLQDTTAYDATLQDGGPEHSAVYANHFDGNDWSEAALISSSSFSGDDDAWDIALDINDTGSALVTAAVARRPDNGGYINQIEAIRLDGPTGQWQAPVLLYEGQVNAYAPSALVENSNRTLAAWAWGYELRASAYDPTTATWGASGPIIDDGVSGELWIDTDNTGGSVAFWNQQDRKEGIYTSRSVDGRTTWAPVGALGAHANEFFVSLSPNGRVIVGASSALIAHDGVYWGTESAIYISTYTPPP